MSKSLKLVRAAWGQLPSTGGPNPLNLDKLTCLKQFLKKVKNEGYCAVELPLVIALDYGKRDLLPIFEENGLNITFQIFTDGPVNITLFLFIIYIFCCTFMYLFRYKYVHNIVCYMVYTVYILYIYYNIL